MFNPGASLHQTLQALHRWQQAGERAALVVITAIEGRTSREVGTVMAVSADGKLSGSISGGCFDAAVVSEAQAALASGVSRLLKLGAGSPWIDIKLPCGGGIDLLIIPNPAGIEYACEAIAARQPYQLLLPEADFTLSILPRLRLIIAGNGGEVPALANLARSIDAEVMAVSPEQALLNTLAQDIEQRHLRTPDALDAIPFDPWTAIAIFFHDHDWEPPLLQRALASDAYFVGAMGSIVTHEARRAALVERGVSTADIARIKSPIGLFGPMRDPQALALSALAQIVAEFPRR
jgi:xanthine dehydrogenase accessory factor